MPLIRPSPLPLHNSKSPSRALKPSEPPPTSDARILPFIAAATFTPRCADASSARGLAFDDAGPACTAAFARSRLLRGSESQLPRSCERHFEPFAFNSILNLTVLSSLPALLASSCIARLFGPLPSRFTPANAYARFDRHLKHCPKLTPFAAKRGLPVFTMCLAGPAPCPASYRIPYSQHLVTLASCRRPRCLIRSLRRLR